MTSKTSSFVEIDRKAADGGEVGQELRDQVEKVITHGARCTIFKSGLPAAAIVPLRDLERLLSMDAELDQQMALQVPEGSENKCRSIPLRDLRRLGPGGS